MQVHPARRHEDVLQEVDRDPAHEEEGMEVDSDRSSERRAAHRVLKRKSGDDRDRHHDGRAKKEPFVACSRRNRLLS